MKGVVGDLEYPECDLTESTQIISQEFSDENDEENEEHCLEAAVVFKQIEAKPPVQFRLNNKNLDLLKISAMGLCVGSPQIDFW